MKKISFLILLFSFLTTKTLSQNYVTYSSYNHTLNVNSGVVGSVGVVVRCFGNTGDPVFLNAGVSCSNNEGIYGFGYSNGSILTPGQNTTLTYQFKKTVSVDTQITYKYSTNGSCFQSESNMIKITVNYKAPLPTIQNNSISGNQTINEGQVAGALSNNQNLTGGNGQYTYQWQKKQENGVWIDIVGATSGIYSPGVSIYTTSYRRIVRSATLTNTSNVVLITVIPAPALLNNTISLNGSTITGSVPTGGTGLYTYSWILLGGEEPYEFPDVGQNLELTPDIYNYINSYPNHNVYRKVTSGRQMIGSNSLLILQIPDIQNNTISIKGNMVEGSIPTGGTGNYTYSWFLGSSNYDPFIFQETTKDLDLTNHQQALDILTTDSSAILFRIVKSGKVSFSNQLSLYIPVPKVGAQNLNSDFISVYPNPTSNIVNFETTFSENKEIEIIIYSNNMNEKKSVYKGFVTPNQIVKCNMPSNFLKGLCFYKIISENKELKTGKIIYN